MGLAAINATIRADNYAGIPYYEKLGFETYAVAEGLPLGDGTPVDRASFEQLHELVKAQAFRLANWRVATDDINYRRFFDTNDLAGIPRVLSATVV